MSAETPSSSRAVAASGSVPRSAAAAASSRAAMAAKMGCGMGEILRAFAFVSSYN
jgi:hypothetical protein